MLLYSKAEDCWPDELPTLVEEVEERRKSWESSKRSSMMSFAMVEPGTGATTTTTGEVSDEGICLGGRVKGMRGTDQRE